MSASVALEAQKLNPDPIVELWELDTTPLTNVLGVTGTGAVYRWTPGVLNVRMQGALAVDGATTAVHLDRLLAGFNTAANYTVQFETGEDGSFSSPFAISDFATDGSVTIIGLVTPLPFTPKAGAAYLIESEGSVWMGGVKYVPAPIEMTGMEWSGQGQLPRPTLRISNIGGLAAALVIEFGDLVGATVTQWTTFRRFLDGEADADPSALSEPVVFTVDRKATHNKNVIEFELAAKLDQQGIALPRRLILRDSCDHTYRQRVATGGDHWVYGTCPYVEERWYKSDDSAGHTPAEDLCGKRLSSCLLRFPGLTRLPFRGFPGVAEVAA